MNEQLLREVESEFNQELDKYMEEWTASLESSFTGPTTKSVEKCDHGPNAGKPGVCPGAGIQETSNRPESTSFSQEDLSGRIGKAVTEAQQVIGKYKEALDKVTDKTVLLQAKEASRFVARQTKRFHNALVERYGEKGAMAVLLSGQALGWGIFGVGAMTGVPLWLPGSSLWGSLPGAAVAEIILQASKLTKKELGEEITPEQAEKLWQEFASWLADEYSKYLEELGVSGEEQA